MTGPPLREWGATLSALGHLGTEGRRPRLLEGVITDVAGDGTVSVSIMGGTPVDGVEVAAGYAGGRAPKRNEDVQISAVQYHHVVVDGYQ